MRSFCSAPQTHSPNTHTYITTFSPGNSTGRGEKWVSRLLYGTCAGERGGEQRGARRPVWSPGSQCIRGWVEQVGAHHLPPTSLPSPPTGHTHEYNRWRWIGLWLCFQGVVFEVNGSIRLCFPRSFSGRQQTAIKMFSIAQRAPENLTCNLAGYSSFPI